MKLPKSSDPNAMELPSGGSKATSGANCNTGPQLAPSNTRDKPKDGLTSLVIQAATPIPVGAIAKEGARVNWLVAPRMTGACQLVPLKKLDRILKVGSSCQAASAFPSASIPTS